MDIIEEEALHRGAIEIAFHPLPEDRNVLFMQNLVRLEIEAPVSGTGVEGDVINKIVRETIGDGLYPVSAINSISLKNSSA